MFRFILKTFLIISILFIGIILGFIEANSGLEKMKGYNNGSIAHVIVEEETDTIEPTILGETVSSHNLEEKRKMLNEVNTYNLFTDVAKKITNILNSMFASVFS